MPEQDIDPIVNRLNHLLNETAVVNKGNEISISTNTPTSSTKKQENDQMMIMSASNTKRAVTEKPTIVKAKKIIWNKHKLMQIIR